MPCRGLREQKKEATLETIRRVALDLFEAQGFDATTMEDIARAAGVSPRTLFRYVDAKVELVLVPKHEDDHSKHRGFVERIAARPATESPLEVMHEVTRTALRDELAEGDPDLLRRIRVVLATPALRTLALEHFNDHRADFTAAFAQRLGVDESHLEPRVLAAMFAEAMWVIIEEWVRRGADLDALDALVDESFRALQSVPRT